MSSSFFPFLRIFALRLPLNVVTALGAALLLSAGGLTAGAQTTTAFTSSGSLSSPAISISGSCASTIPVSGCSASSGTYGKGGYGFSTINVPDAGTVTKVQVELNGLSSSGWNGSPPSSQSDSLGFTSVYLIGPGGQKLELLGCTGDSLDGDDSGTTSSGLDQVNITFVDTGSGAPLDTPWQHTGSTTVKPSSYWTNLNAFCGSTAVPNNAAGLSLAQSDGAATLNGTFANGPSNGNWTLYIDNYDTYLTYAANDPIELGSWTLTLTYNSTVSVPTTTTISSNSNPASPGSVTYTATVSSTSTVNVGSVTFTSNLSNATCAQGNPVAVSSGVANCTVTLSQGMYSIGASYGGGTGFNSSTTSQNLNELVEGATTGGGTDTFCNTGSISLTDGSTLIYPSIIKVTSFPGQTVSNVLVKLLDVQGKVTGSHLLVSPDGNHNLDFLDSAFNESDSTTGAWLYFYDTAGAYPNTTGTTGPPDNSSTSPADYVASDEDSLKTPFPSSGAHAIDSAVPQVPGTINFGYNNVVPSETFGPVTESFESNFSGATADGDWALYPYENFGDIETIAGGWCIDLTVNTGVATTTSVASSQDPQVTGLTVTLTATVTANGNAVTSGGTVTFLENGVAPPGTVGGNNVVPLNGSGQATFTTAALPEGDSLYVVEYSGDSSDNASQTTFTQRANNSTTVVPNGQTITNGPTCSETYCYCNAGPVSTVASFKGAFTPNPSIIDVTNLPGTINRASVGLNQFSTSAAILYAIESMVVSPTGEDLDFFSNVGGAQSNGTLGGTASLGNYIFADAAPNTISNSVTTLSPNTYKPVSFLEEDLNWPEPAQPYTASSSGFYTLPSGITYAASRGSGTFTGQFANTNPNGNWALYMTQDDAGAAASSAHGWCLNLTENPVTVTADLSHQGDGTGTDFVQSETGAHITAVVQSASNTGPTGDPTGTNPLTVVDNLNSALTYTGYSGSNWTCTAPPATSISCTNDSAVAEGTSYPTLTLNVNVASNASSSISNSIGVSGAGVTALTNVTDTITVDANPALSVSKSHSGNFTAGSTGLWTIVVSNTAAGSATSGTVTVADTLPSGYTLASYTSTSSLWTCNGSSNVVTCTATPGIAGNSSSTINLTVNVTSNSPTTVTNTAHAWGGGDTQHTNSGNAAASNTDSVSVSAPPAITSGASTTFLVGTAGSFSVTASGDPAPTFSESGAMPSGVTLSSSGVLSGTPAANSGGPYTFTITASNGIGTNATQSFTLTVDAAPSISSASSATFMAGSASSVTVTTIAFPTASFSESGVLPIGVTFIDNGNGTATLSGTPAANSGGTYIFNITASNGVSPNGTQSFTLAVDQPPAIISAANATFATSVAGSFTVTTNGFPLPALSESGLLPSGVTFTDNGNGTATLAGTPALGSAGSYPLTITATNGIGADGTQSFTLTVNPPPTFVVTTNADDATGTPSNCPIPSSGNTCTLRDALAGATASGSGIITFDGTAFSASNSTAQNTITLTNGTLNIPASTSITGPTSGSGYTLSNLVTVDGSGVAGVIQTASAGVTVSNLAIQNGNSPYGGGIFNNGGAMTVANSTFTNNTASQYGGAICSVGIITVTNSTFTGNTALFGGGVINLEGTMAITDSTFTNNTSSVEGGGFYNNDQGTMSSSTLSGNSASVDGGGIFWGGGPNNMSNSIVSGNSAPSDPDASPFADLGGNQVGVSGINLAPLGNYGGPTQTMIPLPGSTAICGGLASNIPSGTTTDERGFPNTNSTYSGYSPSTLCVDAGAVQTNYAISFTTQPPTSGQTGVALNPAPVVTLTESGTVFTAGPGTIGISDTDADLNGSSTVSVATTSGAASFTSLEFTNAESGDKLIATLALNPAISSTSPAISSVSNPFNVTKSAPPFGWINLLKDAATGGTGAVAQGDSLQVTGVAADPHDGTPVSQVQILIDNTVVGNATLGIASPALEALYNNPAYATGGWTFTYPASGLSLGTHTLTVIASDSLGLSASIATRTFTVATVSSGPPFGWINLLRDAATGGTGAVAQGDSLQVTGVAADPHDGTPVSQVQILIDNTVVGNATLGIASPSLEALYNNPAYATGGWTFTYPASGLSLGTHTLTVIASDSLSLSATIATRTFTVATVSSGPPFGWINLLKDASTGGTGAVAQGDSLQVTGVAADPHDGTPVSQVQILIDNTVVGNATLGIASPSLEALYNNPAYATGGWTFTYPASGLSLGTHTLTVIASDSLGLSATIASHAFTVATVSSGPPFGWINLLKDAATGGTGAVAQGDSLQVTGVAADPHDGTPVSQVQILIDNTVVGNATLGIASLGLETLYNNPAYATGGWTFTYPASGLSLGTHTLTVIASDSLSLSATIATQTFTVTN